MIIPVLYKCDIVIVFSHFLEDHSNFAPEGVEQLLLMYLASEGYMHAIMILFNKFGEILLRVVILLLKHFVTSLQFFQLPYLLTHKLYLFLQQNLIFSQSTQVLLVNVKSLLKVLHYETIAKCICWFNRLNLANIFYLCLAFVIELLLRQQFTILFIGILIQLKGLFLNECFIMHEVAFLCLFCVFPSNAVKKVIGIPQPIF